MCRHAERIQQAHVITFAPVLLCMAGAPGPRRHARAGTEGQVHASAPGTCNLKLLQGSGSVRMTTESKGPGLPSQLLARLPSPSSVKYRTTRSTVFAGSSFVAPVVAGGAFPHRFLCPVPDPLLTQFPACARHWGSPCSRARRAQ